MAVFTGEGWSRNGSDPGPDPAANATVPPDHYRNYYAMFYSLLILAIIFGNVLVCLAVLRERGLQTTTNYLVVSLAVADLLVASLVMPWVVYLEVVGGDWMFSRMYCNIFVTLDVMMCTASILNLCAISIDRYTAVVMPVLYNTTHSSRRRVSVMIAAVWVLAFAVSCPLLFGFNTTADDPSICSISNPDFVIYSSVVSFYLPFVVTLLVYIRIYIFLRKRRKRIAFRKASGNTKSEGYPQSAETCLHTEGAKESLSREKVDLSPIKIKVESAGAPARGGDPLLLSSCLRRKRQKTAPSENKLLPPPDLHNYCSISQASFARTENEPEAGEELEGAGGPKRASEVKNLPNGETRITLRPAPRRRNMQLRERKATQMLAIVLGAMRDFRMKCFATDESRGMTSLITPSHYSRTSALALRSDQLMASISVSEHLLSNFLGVFLVCWLPFFVTHILNTHCKSCYVPPEVYSATTWLGYVNSALNPVIYTTFNIEFRRAFIKILTC
uniref:D(3) dopamine receptor n=1 Tax=Lepisosteus oculatus TaxID=7918 RepID=W5M5U6_LEPOC